MCLDREILLLDNLKLDQTMRIKNIASGGLICTDEG